jgi:hypothetical protein
MARNNLARLLKNPEERLPRELKKYAEREDLDLTSNSSDPRDAAFPRYMLRLFIPLWAGAGMLDWYWHKNTDIEHTAGIRESLLHFGMFTEGGVPLILALFLEINAGVLAAMAAAMLVHELTAFVDVRYALNHREVKNWEQHTHSFLEVLPFAALSMSALTHWDQFRALLGGGPEKPDLRFRMKRRKVPGRYLAAVAGIVVFGVITPFANELWRCWKARNEPHYNSGFYRK